MPQFAYEARDTQGAIQAGLVQADDTRQAGMLLGERGLFVTRLADPRTPTRRHHKAHATRAQAAWIVSQLAVMLETGIVLSEAIDCLIRQTSDARVRALLEALAKGIRGGAPLSVCMDEFPRTFPPSLRALVRSAELSGTLVRTLSRSAEHLLSDLQLTRRARGAAIYPAAMFVLCCTVVVFLLTVILPRFTVLFEGRGQALPGPTRLLIASSDLLVGYWYAWLAAVVVGALLWHEWISTEPGRRRFDAFTIRVPILGRCYTLLYQARCLRTMADLLEAGLPLSDIVPILREAVPNYEYQKLWDAVDQAIHDGQPMTGPILASELFPESVGQMIASGDRAGKLGVVCGRLAGFIEAEHEQAVKTATQFIEPAMILLMGGFVGFIAASLMIPLFQSSMLLAH